MSKRSAFIQTALQILGRKQSASGIFTDARKNTFRVKITMDRLTKKREEKALKALSELPFVISVAWKDNSTDNYHDWYAGYVIHTSERPSHIVIADSFSSRGPLQNGIKKATIIDLPNEKFELRNSSGTTIGIFYNKDQKLHFESNIKLSIKEISEVLILIKDR